MCTHTSKKVQHARTHARTHTNHLHLVCMKQLQLYLYIHVQLACNSPPKGATDYHTIQQTTYSPEVGSRWVGPYRHWFLPSEWDGRDEEQTAGREGQPAAADRYSCRKATRQKGWCMGRYGVHPINSLADLYTIAIDKQSGSDLRWQAVWERFTLGLSL